MYVDLVRPLYPEKTYFTTPMKQELDPKDVAVGVKEVIYLGEDVINERFGLQGDEGAAWMIAGDPTGGNLGGGFIYTNKDSLSLGIVTTISDIGRVDVSVPDMVERMKNHPSRIIRLSLPSSKAAS